MCVLVVVGVMSLVWGLTTFPRLAKFSDAKPDSGAKSSTDLPRTTLENASGSRPAGDVLLEIRREFLSRGVTAGWHCLEVGGGGGSISSWLADRVGPSGRVLVTDIDPRHLKALRLPNVDVSRHDVLTDPLPEGTFDLIHMRLVLVHLPDWRHVLTRLLTALKPGGWLVDEEFDSESIGADPNVGTGEVLLPTHVGLGRLMAGSWFDRRCGRRLFARLRQVGFVDVEAEGSLFMVQRGSLGTALMRANYEQLRETLVEKGYVSDDQITADLARLNEADFVMASSIMWTALGRRPE